MTLYKAMSAVKRRELEAEIERLRAEVGQLHVLRADLENAQRLARIQADELTASEERCQRVTESRDSFLKENGRLKKELLSLCTENAELREHLKGAASVIDREFAAALKPGAGT